MKCELAKFRAQLVVNRVEIPNTQWALYPMGGGISAGGAVITAWFFTAPFITAHVDASD